MLCGIDPWGLRESRICGCSEMPVVWSSIPLVNMNLVFLLETRVKTKQRLSLLLKEGGQAQREPTCFSVFCQKYYTTAAHHAQMEGQMVSTFIIKKLLLYWYVQIENILRYWFWCYSLNDAIPTQTIREVRVTMASCYTLMMPRLRVYITVLPWRKAVVASQTWSFLDGQRNIQWRPASHVSYFTPYGLPKHFENSKWRGESPSICCLHK